MAQPLVGESDLFYMLTLFFCLARFVCTLCICRESSKELFNWASMHFGLNFFLKWFRWTLPAKTIVTHNHKKLMQFFAMFIRQKSRAIVPNFNFSSLFSVMPREVSNWKNSTINISEEMKFIIKTFYKYTCSYL